MSRGRCECGKARVDGRCSAVPSCDDFRKPHQTAKSDEMQTRRRAHRARVDSERVLRATTVTQAARRVDPNRTIYRREQSELITKAKRGMR